MSRSRARSGTEWPAFWSSVCHALPAQVLASESKSVPPLRMVPQLRLSSGRTPELGRAAVISEEAGVAVLRAAVDPEPRNGTKLWLRVLEEVPRGGRALHALRLNAATRAKRIFIKIIGVLTHNTHDNPPILAPGAWHVAGAED